MKKILLPPNLLTFLRILLVAPTFYLLENDQIFAAAFCIGLGFLTDFLDGKVARRFGWTTNFGAILDPIADKIVVLSYFIYFALQGEVLLFYFMLILTRDIAQILSVPILIWWKQISFQVKPKLIPKWGTALNFVILGILFTRTYIWSPAEINWALFPLYGISGLIEIYILVTYIPRFIQIYRGQHDTFE